MRGIGLWLRRQPDSLSRLVHLRIKVSCDRASNDAETWKLLIAALAARERSLAVSGEIWLDAAVGGGSHRADSKRSSSGWFQSFVPWTSSLS
ncbi:hypothetical protein AURDEDRAFT_112022 [Auricularia subglabra TFB-10046 SS5]|nr:hypothetical protein AURDEDRAFT_112022 [Auricularia subglabra TFB-10046 SS5]